MAAVPESVTEMPPATESGTLTNAEGNFLPTVYFKKIRLDNGSFQGVQTKHLWPTIGPGQCPHPQQDLDLFPAYLSAAEQSIVYRNRASYGPGCGSYALGGAPTRADTATATERLNPLIVTLNLELKFEFNTSDPSKVMLDENLLRFANVVVERHMGPTQSESVVVPLLDQSLSDYVGSDPHILDDYSPILTERGTILISIPLRIEDYDINYDFEEANPGYLAYYALCKLSMEALSDEYGFDTGDLPITATGNTTGEIIFNNAELVKTANVFLIEETTFTPYGDDSTDYGSDEKIFNIPPANSRGKVWSGGWDTLDMNGLRYFHTVSTDEKYNKLLLKRLSVPNNKIVDYRLIDKILDINIDISPATSVVDDLLDALPCNGTGGTSAVLGNWFNDASPYLADRQYADRFLSCLKSRRIKIDVPEMYLSDAYMSRDHDGNCRFLFHIDFDRLIRDKSLFGSLYTDANKDDIKKYSRILNLKVVRRRIDVEPSVNRLGTPIDGRATDFDNLIEFIVESNDDPSSADSYHFMLENNGKGQIKEITSLTIPTVGTAFCPNGTCWSGDLGETNIRTFVVTDFSVAGTSGGGLKNKNYQYRQQETARPGLYYGPVLAHQLGGTTEPPTSPGGIYYQYGIELEVEDGTINFLNSMLDNDTGDLKGLIQIRNHLKDYYGDVEQYMISKRVINKNILQETDAAKFDAVPANIADARGYIGCEGSVTLSSCKGPLPWAYIPGLLARRVFQLTNKSAIDVLAGEFYSYLDPNQEAPALLAGINSLISLTDKIIMQLEAALGKYLSSSRLVYGLKPIGVNSSIKRTAMTLNKYFYGVFDASQPRDVFYDILGPQDGVYGSLFKLSPEAFTARSSTETKMTWVSDVQTVLQSKADLAAKAPYENSVFEEIVEINSSKDTYFSPWAISVGSGVDMTLKRADQGLKMWDTTQECMGNGVVGLDRASSTAALAIAHNMGDFVQYGPSSLAENSFEASKHILKKLGVAVMDPPIPKILNVDKIGLTDSNFVPVAEILSPDDRQVRENLVGAAAEISQTQRDFEVAQRHTQLAFSNALPVTMKFVQNLARNGAYRRGQLERLPISPHKIVPPSMNKGMFNINDSNSIIERSRKSDPSKTGTANMPNSVKSLAASETDATQTDPLASAGDPWSSPMGAAAMTWNYETISRIEVLVGFERAYDTATREDMVSLPAGTSNARPLLQKPIFQKLQGPAALSPSDAFTAFTTIMNELDNSCILCRLQREENPTIGLVAKNGLDLPILNEYFLLSQGDITRLKNIPVASYESFDTTKNMYGGVTTTTGGSKTGGGTGGKTGGGTGGIIIINTQPAPPEAGGKGGWKNNPNPAGEYPGGGQAGEKGDSSTSF